MEFGRGPSTPSHSTALARGGPKTPQSARHRIRSGGLQSPSMSRVSQLQSPCGTPKQSGLVSQLASTASPLSMATGTNPSTGGNSNSRRPDTKDMSPISGRIRKVFSSLPINSSFSLSDQIGEGTFSTVYLAKRIGNGQGFNSLALKHLVPTSKPGRIMMEARCMQVADGHPNVVQLVGLWRVGGDVVLAMPYIQHCRFIDLVATVELEEVMLFTANLLAALEHIHKLGIIHRDIKPSNFLYDRQRKKFSLVDFGLAQWEQELQLGGKGAKRKGEEVESGSSKKARPPLAEVDAKLNCSPRARIIREHKSPGVRRSPRKMVSPGGGGGDLHQVQLGSPTEVPKQRLSFGTPTKQSPIRCSPRKLPMSTRPGVSKLTITANSIVSPDCSTPSSTLHRVPSFTMLEPSGHSQQTDFPGRTPLLRASVTSHCSSTIPRPDLATPRPSSGPGPSALSVSCSCPGQLSVCPACLSLPHLHAARAGTPGFRPPEVLLKCPTQTVAVDMWAVGVILLSILSRSYPFFRAPDDMTALAELMTLFGTKQVQQAAKRYNRRLTVSLMKEGCDLASVCRQLGARGEDPPPSLVTEEAISLLKLLLRLDYRDRATARQALNHPFVRGQSIPGRSSGTD